VHGILSPSAFLPSPNDPLHKALADFVIRRALADWPAFAARKLPLKLAVNVPASVLEDYEFVGHVRRYLPAQPAFPGLVVELTEDEVIRDPVFVAEIATQLKLYNIDLAIDDFGCAHSTLQRLTQLPFAELKIDGKFVRQCASDPRRRQLCRSIIAMAHKHNMTVVAEGVEDADDLRALDEMGCDGAQGYLFAKPMSKDAFLETLLSRARLPT
jgi:EAL domain-containing protein (putative c-di-GMP-specific phosphodiesterase class I)